MSLRWRISGALAVIAALVSIAGGLAAYRSSDAELTHNLDDGLRDSAARVLGFANHDDHDDVHGNDHDDDNRPVRQSDICPLALLQPIDAAQLIYTDGTSEPCFTDSPQLPFDDGDIATATSSSIDIDDFPMHTVHVDGETYRVITVPWAGNGAVQAARNMGSIDDVLSGISLRLALAGLVATIGAWIIGWFIAGRIAKPIRRLSTVATTIASTRDLTQPVPTDGAGEVGDLGRAFASMTNALSTSLEQQKRLINDASHEMRTPLTALRTNVESLDIFESISPEERREMLRDIRHEVEELANLTAELVDLATDRGVVDEPESSIDLYDVAREVARRAERRSGRSITITDNGRNPVNGRLAQIQRAITNLVDNAIKYSPEGSPIDIDVDGGHLRVRDHGPGISEADRPHVFERFYRAIEARSAPGSGLGLSIVAQTVEQHGGTVFVDNAPDGGAIVGFDLPE